jgi:hypothetical protein
VTGVPSVSARKPLARRSVMMRVFTKSSGCAVRAAGGSGARWPSTVWTGAVVGSKVWSLSSIYIA